MKRKILIIEDNEQNMYMLSFLLEQNNYTIYKAFNGLDGIRTALEILPNIVLLDIQLPEMDGYTVATKLRENECLNKIPIIAVTSYAMLGDKEKILSKGANGYIEKPIDPENFIDKMENIVNEFYNKS
jgi:CheY-like chemotaxis protein